MSNAVGFSGNTAVGQATNVHSSALSYSSYCPAPHMNTTYPLSYSSYCPAPHMNTTYHPPIQFLEQRQARISGTSVCIAKHVFLEHPYASEMQKVQNISWEVLFRELDQDKDGYASMTQLKTWLDGHPEANSLTTQERQRLWRSASDENIDKLKFYEFMVLMIAATENRHNQTDEEVDNQGRKKKDALSPVSEFSHEDDDCKELQLLEMLKKLDKDKDGYITIAQFNQWQYNVANILTLSAEKIKLLLDGAGYSEENINFYAFLVLAATVVALVTREQSKKAMQQYDKNNKAITTSQTGNNVSTTTNNAANVTSTGADHSSDSSSRAKVSVPIPGSIPVFVPLITFAQVAIYATYCLDINNGIRLLSLPILTHVYIYNSTKRVEPWRYVTYCFMHISFDHILFNAVLQIMFGLTLEVVHSYWRVSFIYFSGVLAGSVGVTLVGSSSAYLAGASTGIYALIGAHLSNLYLNWSKIHFATRIPRLLMIIVVLCHELFSAVNKRRANTAAEIRSNAIRCRVSHVAHASGFAIGCLGGIILLPMHNTYLYFLISFFHSDWIFPLAFSLTLIGSFVAIQKMFGEMYL